MKLSLATILVAAGSLTILSGTGVPRWPDLSVPVPPLVRQFILAECQEADGTTEEDFGACVAAESLGYRATVMMLTDRESGEAASERYRACRGGLGTEGGRFHRRRAVCMGYFFGVAWRFEPTQRAEPGETRAPHRFAATSPATIR